MAASSIIVLGQVVEANIKNETETKQMMGLNRHNLEIENIFQTGFKKPSEGIAKAAEVVTKKTFKSCPQAEELLPSIIVRKPRSPAGC